ncbi:MULTISPECIES: hypothetical protein [Vibrio]|uniref:Uncharacterized protein n=1 Tax=Vibrio vulnificus TaxID=672 RepID=A0A2S3R1A0_VIBVL|nr:MULTISPECIES: hypothetical protein [Vibrio]MCZ2802034.1 hypothetical protein [Vibrio alginolyticus]POB46881.1 hypothetical protein CRN52_12440 [Vibrio vulnificus]
MNYKQILPGEGWYFVHENPNDEPQKYTVYRVAVWALCEDGDVFGLIHPSGLPNKPGETPKLVTPPPIQGSYLHESELTSEQKAAYSKCT